MDSRISKPLAAPIALSDHALTAVTGGRHRGEREHHSHHHRHGGGGGGPAPSLVLSQGNVANAYVNAPNNTGVIEIFISQGNGANVAV